MVTLITAAMFLSLAPLACQLFGVASGRSGHDCKVDVVSVFGMKVLFVLLGVVLVAIARVEVENACGV